MSSVKKETRISPKSIDRSTIRTDNLRDIVFQDIHGKKVKVTSVYNAVGTNMAVCKEYKAEKKQSFHLDADVVVSLIKSGTYKIL